MGIVKFDDPSGPNMAGNLLPNHPNLGECAEFKAFVQSLMDNKELEFLEEVKGPKRMSGNLNINAISEE
ncbi:hypothetical protein GOBAR_DD32749 [Gossypium barbadense]|nr:hypothetical protein GOBAR_DD32749 [Gossypium barbadense]